MGLGLLGCYLNINVNIAWHLNLEWTKWQQNGLNVITLKKKNCCGVQYVKRIQFVKKKK